MKKKKIAGINFKVSETAKGLYFQCDKKDDIKAALKLTLNGVIEEIQDVLDTKFGKGQFFYKSGGHLEDGLQFNYSPGKLLDRL